ncbi:MAG: DUF294 nucleotidyltransferase-like domain-containing protein [Bacillota bacterium]
MHEAALTEPAQIYSILKATKPFHLLDDLLLHKIAGATTVKQYLQGSYVFKQGERSQKALFIVVEGQAKIVAAPNDEEPAAGYRNPGDFFGETVFLSDDTYPASVSAVTALICLLITQKSFELAFNSNREFADFFTKALATRLRELYHTFLFEHPEKENLYGQPLRKRVAEIAVSEVITCFPLARVKEIAEKMSAGEVSSLVVVAPNQKPVGIITEKDLVTKVLAAPEPGLEKSAYEIMSPNLITIGPWDFAYQALLLMIKHKIKHVVVTDESRRLCGIVTVQDLIRNRNTGALTIVNRIELQESLDGLAAVMDEVDQVQQALIAERAYASEICALVTELYDRVTRKVISIAEKEMAAEGKGRPPADYCFINMGSSGRKEQFARTDQDNGIIYRDPPLQEKTATAAYFLALGVKIVHGLERCGFQRCRGGVMADNTRWCRPLAEWRAGIKQWVDQLEPENIRDMTIFLDFRYLTGEVELFDHLKDYVCRLLQGARHALLFMAEDDLKHRVPLNIFRRIVTERTGQHRKMINLKATSGVHILDCLRIFALREGIKETNTFERLHRLRERGVFKSDDADYIEAAFETLLMLRLRDALQKTKQGLEPDNYISPASLTKKEQSLLKESLLVVNRLQTLAAHAFRVQNV